MSDASTMANISENAADLAAREKIGIPEQDAGVSAAREPIKPVEHMEQIPEKREKVPAPEQLIAEIPVEQKQAPVVNISTHPKHSNVITADTFRQAEQNLAAYLGQKFDSTLTQDMQLTLSNVLSDGNGKVGGTTLKMCFTGPQIEANFAELSRELITALQEHPLISKLLRENKTVLIEQANNDEKGQMLHLHLPNFAAEEYAHFMNTLGARPVAAAPAHINKAHAEQVASILEKAAEALRADPKAEAARANGANAAASAPAIAMDAVKSETAAQASDAQTAAQAPVIAMESSPAAALQAVPQTTVEAPVLKMGVQQDASQLKRA